MGATAPFSFRRARRKRITAAHTHFHPHTLPPTHPCLAPCWFIRQQRMRKGSKRIEAIADIEGYDELKAEDQALLADLVKNPPPLPKRKSKPKAATAVAAAAAATPATSPRKRTTGARSGSASGAPDAKRSKGSASSTAGPSLIMVRSDAQAKPRPLEGPLVVEGGTGTGTATRRAWLEPVEPGSLRPLVLPATKTTLGRDNMLVGVPSTQISRQHAVFEFDETSGNLTVQAIGLNPCAVSRGGGSAAAADESPTERLSRYESTNLGDGDLLWMTKHGYRYRVRVAEAVTLTPLGAQVADALSTGAVPNFFGGQTTLPKPGTDPVGCRAKAIHAAARQRNAVNRAMGGGVVKPQRVVESAVAPAAAAAAATSDGAPAPTGKKRVKAVYDARADNGKRIW